MSTEEEDKSRQTDVEPRRPPSPVPLRASSVPFITREYTVGYVYSSEMMVHACLKGHPEQPERISSIFQAIKDAKYHLRMKQLPIRPVKRSEALLVHSEDHWEKVLDIACK